MAYQSLNPATEEILNTYPALSFEQAEDLARQTAQVARAWRDSPFAERRKLLHNAARILSEQKHHLSGLITEEMGKPCTQAVAEVEKCALACDYYADHGESFLREEPVFSSPNKGLVRFDPLGVVLGIMPWNFPFWQVFRFAVPALTAGNGALLKHASNVPGTALAIEEIFAQAGAPKGLFRTLLISGETAGRLIASPHIQAVSLTGSSRAGKEVAAQAGRHLKKSVLELGGSDPFIVLKDADLPKAVATAVTARMQNAGQSCIAAKRFIVVKEIYQEFEKKFVEAVKKLKVGDPKDPETELGPMAREDLLEELDRQVQDSLSQGAVLKTGGERLPGKGFFYAPTVLAKVAPGMKVFDEETFGPVASLIEAKNEDHAIELANQTCYGLGASLWTQDLKRGEALAQKVEAGSVFINVMVRSDPRLPFGGIKESGYGRELGPWGLREFVDIKSVVVSSTLSLEGVGGSE